MCVNLFEFHTFFILLQKKGEIFMDFNAFIKENYNENDKIARMSIKSPEHGYRVQTYHYDASELAKASCQENNLYFALNPMKFINKSIRRDKQHVARLKFLYVDLDIYKSEWKDFTQTQILMQLESEYFDIKIPSPSYVVNSGRGMYLLWRIDEHINAQPRWEKVQAFLNSQLIEFGADRAVVTDTARVLRIPGSINSKSRTEVFIMDSYNTNYTYTLYEIMQEYMQNDIASFQYTKKKAPKRNYKASSKIVFMNTPYSLYNARISDLEHLLLKYRDKESGMRENILFLYRYYTLCISNDKAESLNMTLALNSRLKYALDEKEVIKATASAEKYYDNNRCFQISNDKLVDFLNIEPDEMKEMRSIITSCEKSARKSARDRKAYLKKLEAKGESTKEYKIKLRLKAIYELLEQGKTQREICAELNISKSTFYSDKKVMEQYTYEQLCEAVQDNTIINQNTDETSFSSGSPENSAPVLREDVVLHAHDRQKAYYTISYSSYQLDDLLNTS